MRDHIRALREKIGHMKILVPGVRAVLLNAQGEVLLGRQAAFGSWALPHGCVDVDESVLQALKRETREETGLSVLRAEAFAIYSDPRYSVTYPNGDEVQTFTVAFHVQKWSGVPACDGVEIAELGFFPLDRLPAPLYPIHVDTLADYRNGRRSFIVR